MSIMDIHSKAVERYDVVFHKFMASYKSDGKVVYGFVEGKDDPSFYRIKINDRLPEEWRVILLLAGNKFNVSSLYKMFDWDRFPKQRIVFFLDRDLSDYIKEDIPEDDNAYITDGYSIENNIVCRDTCEATLKEIFNLYSAQDHELNYTLDLFDSMLAYFQANMINIMAWILYWKRSGENLQLGNITLGHLFKFENNFLTKIQHPCGYANEVEYIHKKCGVDYHQDIDIGPEFQKYISHPNHLQLIRGKYVMWFLIEFIVYIKNNYNIFFKGIKKIKSHVTICQDTGVSIVGLRSRIPSSLKDFIDRTLKEYALSRELNSYTS